MRSTNKLNFSLISKRLTCKNSSIKESSLLQEDSKNKANSEKLYTDINSMIESNNNIPNVQIQSQLNKLLVSMYNTECASDYWYYPLDIAQKFTDKYISTQNFIVERFCDSILPYSDSLSNIKSCLEYNDVILSDENKRLITEKVNLLSAADRIINNHNNISKRYNMESESKAYNSLGLKYLVDSVAMKIDTYAGIKPYQKMNLVIEEIYYLLNKEGKKYDTQDLVKYTLEYFLLENTFISKSDLDNFNRALVENYLLEEADLEKIEPIFNVKDPADSISSMTVKFYTYPEKNCNNLKELVISVLHKTSKEDIVANFDKLIYFLWDLFNSSVLDGESDHISPILWEIRHYIEACTTTTSSDIIPNKLFNKNDIATIIDKLAEIRHTLWNYRQANPMFQRRVDIFLSLLEYMGEQLISVRDMLYSDTNIENINKINSCEESVDIKKFKTIYFTEIMNYAETLNNLISVKESKTKLQFTNVSSNVFSFPVMRENFYSYIGADNKAEITLRQYMISTAVYKESEVVNYLDNICNECNDILAANNIDNLVCYYLTTESIAEIRLKDKRELILDEAAIKMINESYDIDSQMYIDCLEETSKYLSVAEELPDVNLEDYLLDFSRYKTFTKEHFELALEALKYIDIDDDTLKLFAERFNEYQFTTVLESSGVEAINLLSLQEKTVLKEVTDLCRTKPLTFEIPGEIQTEATSYLVALFENLADDWDDIEDDGEDDDEEEKPKKSEKEEDKENEEKLKKDPKYNKDAKDSENYKPSRSRSKISLNKLKLGILGLHNKFKEMSNKEKEVSRNLDNSVRALVKSMKGMFVSDRREAIIKGSLIPSFSRCIKNGIILAGLGVATSSVVVPAIAAVGGIALSKRLTYKERMILLDDIETELDVVEKELSIAESNNKMNQYRALLQYKKELQRQYQRIRYNVRVGKDILPGSATGVPNNH